MTMNEESTYELKPDHIEYLQKMASKYDLPDASKALRCLLNFAMQELEHESNIFEEIRCPHC